MCELIYHKTLIVSLMDRKRSKRNSNEISAHLRLNHLAASATVESEQETEREREREREKHQSIRQRNSPSPPLFCREYNFLAPTVYVHAYTTGYITIHRGSSGNASTRCRLQSISGARYYFESDRDRTGRESRDIVPRSARRRGRRRWKAFDVSELSVDGFGSLFLYERQRTLIPRSLKLTEGRWWPVGINVCLSCPGE